MNPLNPHSAYSPVAFFIVSLMKDKLVVLVGPTVAKVTIFDSSAL